MKGIKFGSFLARHKFVVSVTLIITLFPILIALTPLALLLIGLWTWVGLSELKDK